MTLLQRSGTTVDHPEVNKAARDAQITLSVADHQGEQKQTK